MKEAERGGATICKDSERCWEKQSARQRHKGNAVVVYNVVSAKDKVENVTFCCFAGREESAERARKRERERESSA